MTMAAIHGRRDISRRFSVTRLKYSHLWMVMGLDSMSAVAAWCDAFRKRLRMTMLISLALV